MGNTFLCVNGLKKIPQVSYRYTCLLCRLAENGYQLAHRYWPEEGSEQYHIYEVRIYYSR